jgi:hypothetical protein
MEKNTPAQSLVVRVNHGVLKNHGKGAYTYTTDSLAPVTFTVISKTTKASASWLYEVHDVPLPVAKVGNNYGGNISKARLAFQQGVKADVFLWGSVFGHAIINIDSFSVLIIRRDSILHLENIKGAAFYPTTKQAFRKLKTGDKLIIYNIQAWRPGGLKRLQPIEFTVFDELSLTIGPGSILYRGVENILTVQKDESWSDFVIKADHGALKQRKQGEYVYTTDSLAPVTFTVWNNQTKQSLVFRHEVSNVPNPVIVEERSDSPVPISRDELLTQKEITSHLDLPHMVTQGEKIVVDSFDVVIFRGDSVLHSEKIAGPAFSGKTKKAFQELQNGDMILLVDIRVRVPSGSSRTLAQQISWIVSGYSPVK